MGWMEFVLAIATLVLGTGWLFTYRAYKRKNEGEATQAEADGWNKVQEVYKRTIDDLNGICEEIRNDRDSVMEKNKDLVKLNDELRQRYVSMENQIMELKKELSRQEQKIEALTPLLCAKVGCLKRTKVDLHEDEESTDTP